jgi:molecular chaperone DnaK
MGYSLGVDLGTTYTAAAVARDGRAEIATLGSRTAAIPSVVLVRDDQVLTGEAASRRAAAEPDRVAREFKRRLGDTTPLFLGGAPYSAEALTARLLDAVVDEVSQREGGRPDRVAVTHPANWGPYKQELLDNAIRQAGIEGAVTLTEPLAAAIHYASTERVDVGDVVAVYDLGGGTFDAAVLRKTATAWESLGRPEGIEHLGGIDFDAAVFAHVQRTLGPALEALDEDDQAAMAAVGRLRQECIDAKEALSADTDVSIPVLLPNVQTEVRLTRSEFEDMIRPGISDTINALARALRGAGVEATDVKAVLLVGGSSRIPLVAQMVTSALGRPVNVDAHPKHAIALGAALAAAGRDERAGSAGPVAPSRKAAAAAGAGAIVAAGAGVAAASDATAQMAGASGAGASTGGGTGAPTPSGTSGVPPSGGGTPPPRGGYGQGGDPEDNSPRRRLLIIAAAALVALLLIGGGVVLASSGDDGTTTTTTTTSTAPTTAPTTVPPTTPRTTPRTNPPTTTQPPTTTTTTPPTTTTTTTAPGP